MFQNLSKAQILAGYLAVVTSPLTVGGLAAYAFGEKTPKEAKESKTSSEQTIPLEAAAKAPVIDLKESTFKPHIGYPGGTF